MGTISAEEMKERGMCDMTGTCAFCGQQRIVWTASPQEYSEDDLNKIATSECECPGAVKEEKKRQLYNSGKDAIEITLTNKHRGIASPIMEAGLDALVSGRIKKISVQMDKQTKVSMFLAKVEREGGKDTRVIVDCNTQCYEWSDGEQEE